MVNRNFIWRTTLIVGLFILACGFLLSGSPVLAETTSTPQECTDTDGGNDVFVKGTAYGDHGIFVGVTTSQDVCNTCNDDGQCTGDSVVGAGLVERVCENDMVLSPYEECPYNYACYDGACVTTESTSTLKFTCVETDGGNDYYNAGIVTGVNNATYGGYTTVYDKCEGDLLKEYSCFEPNVPGAVYPVVVGMQEINCEFGCQDGACVSTSTPQTCYDEDGGFDYYTKSHLVGEMYQGEGNNYYHLDSYDACTDATRLSEYFCYLGGDPIAGDTAALSGEPEGVWFGAWDTYNCANEGKICSDGKCVVISAEDLIDQEEQDSAEDLAGEIASLDEGVDYYYGYGYYDSEQEGWGYGYGYYAGSEGSGGGGYGYGYNYGDQANKSGKIDKVLNPKILPDSPFYIFKLAGKGVRSWFTFDKEEKAKLRMRYAAEKMLEAKLVDPDTAAKHMRRYRRDVEKVQKTLIKLEKDDQEAARRLAAVAMRLRLKEQVLLGKVEREAPIDRLERVKEARRVAIEDIKTNAEAVENPREVRRVFELAMDSKSPMNSARNLEILEAVEQTGTSAATDEVVRNLKEQYGDRLARQVVKLVELDSSLLRDYVGISGNEVNNMKVLNNLEERVRGEAVIDEAVIEEIESSRERVADRIETKIEEVRERDRGEALREILGTTEDVRIIREVERRIAPELSASVREVRQKVEERREEEGLPLASTAERAVVESYSCPNGFVEQDSFTRDCGSRPENTVCVSYGDGFVWLIEDGIAGWAKDGERVQIAKGNNFEYHHLLGTDCIKTARVGTTAEAVDEIVSDESASATHAEAVDDEIITREPETVGDSATHSTEDMTTEVRRTTEDTREVPEEIRVDEPAERDVREEEPTVIVEETRCTEDTWECADWSDCSERGEQTRTCRMSYDCPDARTATPTQTQSCTPSCTADTWDCGDWSTCSDAGSQTRTCRLSYDCENDRSATPDQTQSCTPTVVTRNPDLTISSFTYEPTAITAGNAVTFYATVYNQGDGDAERSTAYLYVDGRMVGSLSTSALIIDATTDLSWRSIWTATAGDHTIQVCADATSVLTETNESNNCSSSRLTVQEAVPVGRGASISSGVELWEDFVSFFVPVTRAFRFGSEVLTSN